MLVMLMATNLVCHSVSCSPGHGVFLNSDMVYYLPEDQPYTLSAAHESAFVYFGSSVQLACVCLYSVTQRQSIIGTRFIGLCWYRLAQGSSTGLGVSTGRPHGFLRVPESWTYPGMLLHDAGNGSTVGLKDLSWGLYRPELVHVQLA